MIRADQLQIGDFVLVSGTPRRVEHITKKKIGFHFNPQTDKRLCYARLHDVEPIGITGEILEKKGFGTKGMTTIYFLEGELPDDFIWNITLDLRYRVVDVILWKRIQPKDSTYDDLVTQRKVFVKSLYFHQLQQACRMCGIKIEWKL